MFEISTYRLEYEKQVFKFITIYASFVRKYIVILTNTTYLTYIIFRENEESLDNVYQFAFKTNSEILKKNTELLFSGLTTIGIPITFYKTIIHSVATQLQHTKTMDHIYIRTYNHIYRIYVKENVYNYYVTVGGKQFSKCIELFIYKSGDSSLAQVYSEPECTIDGFMEGGGETVDMIKGSLQICQYLFNVSEFTLHDMSEIECSTKNYSKPIGKRITKPFSLTHLSIINKCKTWYEEQFNAVLKTPDAREAYEKGLRNLNKKIQIPFETFAQDPSLHLSDELIAELAPYFSPEKTWIQFLRAIPKQKQCSLLEWAPNFMDRLMEFQPRNHKWVIQLSENPILLFPFPVKKQVLNKDVCEINKYTEPMKPGLMVPMGIYKHEGGSKTRKQRRNTCIVFRNRGEQYRVL